MHLSYTHTLSLHVCPRALASFSRACHTAGLPVLLPYDLPDKLAHFPWSHLDLQIPKTLQRAAFPGAYITGRGTGKLCETICT